ncbi:MAG: TraB/VirB10 family protein [Candidatus Obscuribacterales bacterium]
MSKEILSKQRRLFGFIAAGIFLLIVGVSFISWTKPTNPVQMVKQRPADLPSDSISPQEIWMTRLEGENKRLDAKVSYLESLLLETKKQDEAKDRDNAGLRAEVARLKQELRAIPPTVESVSPGLPPADDPFGDRPLPKQATSFAPLREYAMASRPSTLQNVLSTIPAGTTVRGVLVSSVDAPCGVLSSANPQPVKIRLLDDGHLPKGVEVALKGGVIIGSAYGDLSSERVYMRLERLTQVNPDGDFVETDLAGYVSGEDGRYGVRGTVVDKSGKLVASAATSGFVSGASQAIQAAFQPKGGGIGSSAMYLDLLQRSSTSGGTSALDRLSDYYIKRAEQIQPVILVEAGRMVDITLTHGCDVGDLHTKDKVRKVREQSRRAP